MDRMLKKGHIGHNKFIVYVKGNKPQAVLTGSTNWTPTGLCAQSNNAILLESPALAKEYLEYWKRLKADTQEAGDERSDLQDKSLRDANRPRGEDHALANFTGQPAGNVNVCSPQHASEVRTHQEQSDPGGFG